MIVYEDGIINFALHQQAKIFYLLKKVGYYYLNNRYNSSNKNGKKYYFRYLFLYLKFIFENTRNTRYDKLKPFLILNKYIKNIKIVKNINYDLNFFLDVINNYLKCKFINKIDKIKLTNMRNIIIMNKKKK